MNIALLAFDGFDELSTFVALGMLDRLRPEGWAVQVAGPAARITSMGGLTVDAQQPLEFANSADAVVFCSGLYSRAIAENGVLLDRLQLDPLRQLISGQCAGTLLMARLGLLGTMPACTDPATKPWLVQAGVLVVDEPFHARGPVATAGGPMAAQYLAAWLIARRAGIEMAKRVLQAVGPVGEKEAYAERLLATVQPFIADEPNGSH